MPTFRALCLRVPHEYSKQLVERKGKSTGILCTLKGNASDFQAHSAKFTNSLSMVYLGREVLKKKLIVSTLQLLNAINILACMVVEAQLEKHVYE